jgi:ribonucleoside-diphosphate reductase beta chain
MMDDVNDWENKLSPAQKDFLTNIFRFFTQGDVDVAGGYYRIFLPLLGKHPEATMMMGSFAAREGIHIAAYSYLIETLGMPESTYSDFLKYAEMKNKQDYLNAFIERARVLLGKDELSLEDREYIAVAIALFAGFTEGMQLFSSFAMLLMFPINGLMKQMGQIVSWSIADETLHIAGMMDMFETWVSENVDIDRVKLEQRVATVANEMVQLEKAFIELIFAKYDSSEFFGLTADRLERYVEFVADHRMSSMNFAKIYNTSSTNPLPELTVMINAPTHTNFFENTSTDYANVSTMGTWADVWG